MVATLQCACRQTNGRLMNDRILPGFNLCNGHSLFLIGTEEDRIRQFSNFNEELLIKDPPL
jgi:hypothetical protein